MLFSALSASFLAFTVAKAQKESPKEHKCSKDLAEIVYAPENYWGNYLRDISVPLRNIADFYDFPFGTDMILNFQNRYKVTVDLIEPFNEVLSYAEVSGHADVTEEDQTSYGHKHARSLLNLGSFDQNSTHYKYAFLSFGSNAKMVQVHLYRAKEDNVSN